MTIGAIATRDNVAGGQRTTDGLWKHYSALDVGSLRVTSRAGHPALNGAGVETIYQPGGGTIQCFNRDSQAYENLVLYGKDIYLQPNSGQLFLPANCVGTSQLQANAASQMLASFQSGSGWNSSANGVWQETNIQINITAGGNPVRMDWSVTFRNTVTGAINQIGLGLDGNTAGVWQVAIAHTPSADYWVQCGGSFYNTVAAGAHRLSIFIATNPGIVYFNAGVYQILAATEIKR